MATSICGWKGPRSLSAELPSDVLILLLFIPRDALQIGWNFQDVRGGQEGGALNWSVEACSQMVSRIMVCAWSDVSTVFAMEEKENHVKKSCTALRTVETLDLVVCCSRIALSTRLKVAAENRRLDTLTNHSFCERKNSDCAHTSLGSPCMQIRCVECRGSVRCRASGPKSKIPIVNCITGIVAHNRNAAHHAAARRFFTCNFTCKDSVLAIPTRP